MRKIVSNLNQIVSKISYDWKIVACCCGHGKYTPSIIIQWGIKDYFVDIYSGFSIPRKKKFYKYDKQGYPYIPETINSIDKKDFNKMLRRLDKQVEKEVRK